MVTTRRLQRLSKMAKKRQSGITVVLENIKDPHNAQAILRSCDAFGVQNVALIFETVEPFDPFSMGYRSSASAHKWLHFTMYNSTESCLAELNKNNTQVIVTALEETSVSIYDVDFCQNVEMALCIGNEKSGISKTLQESADHVLTIPMQGMVQSLNVSNTAAICLYELSRQRQSSPNSMELSHKEQVKLVSDLLQREYQNRALPR